MAPSFCRSWRGISDTPHITSVRSDNVLPELLGRDGIAGDDSARRAFLHASEEALTQWLDRHMNTVFEPLLSETWVLDVDAAILHSIGDIAKHQRLHASQEANLSAEEMLNEPRKDAGQFANFLRDRAQNLRRHYR